MCLYLLDAKSPAEIPKKPQLLTLWHLGILDKRKNCQRGKFRSVNPLPPRRSAPPRRIQMNLGSLYRFYWAVCTMGLSRIRGFEPYMHLIAVSKKQPLTFGLAAVERQPWQARPGSVTLHIRVA